MNLILECVGKSALILAAAWVAAVMLRRGSADLRHRVWLAAMLAVAALPVLLLAMPASWAVVRIDAAAQIVSGTAQAARAVQGLAQGFPWLGIVWGAGAALVVIRLLAGILAIARITRTAALRDGVFYSDRVSTPLTWGFFRPAVVLPSAAMEWSEARLAVVLRHERAHFARHDWLWQTVSRSICALFWFQPLVWLADAALRREAEQAVDDRVLEMGTDPAEYAAQLLAVARALTGAAPAQAVAMVRSAALEARVRSILDASRQRVPAGWPTRAAIVAAAVALVLPLAGFQDSTVHKIGEEGLLPPRVVEKVEPQYTAEARDAGISGTTVLQCVIDEGGKARDIEVTKSLDPGLDANAVAAIAQWTFAPGTKDSKPVSVQATIEINFKLK